MRTLLVFALVVALPAPVLRAQSLGELAAQEKARREKEKEKKARPAAKVYTDNDLQDGGTTTTSPRSSAAPVSPPSDAPEPSESESSRVAEAQAAQAALRTRIAEAKANLEAARDELKGFEDEVERLKQELNPMSTTYNTDAYVLFRLQGQLKEAADKADAVRPKVAEAEKAWEAVERAARNAGVPTE